VPDLTPIEPTQIASAAADLPKSGRLMRSIRSDSWLQNRADCVEVGRLVDAVADGRLERREMAKQTLLGLRKRSRLLDPFDVLLAGVLPSAIWEGEIPPLDGS
jgi:hypothetical protein